MSRNTNHIDWSKNLKCINNGHSLDGDRICYSIVGNYLIEVGLEGPATEPEELSVKAFDISNLDYDKLFQAYLNDMDPEVYCIFDEWGGTVDWVMENCPKVDNIIF